MSTHTCQEGGALVPAAYWLPTDAHDFGWSALDLPIGCNHLVCQGCGAPVKQGAFEPAPDTALPAAAQLYDLDWAATAALVPATTATAGRLYACRCAVERIYGPRTVAPAWGHGTDTPAPWRCAGHPALTLPGTLDGAAISAETLAACVDEGLRGAAVEPWQGHEPARTWRRHPGLWVARLAALLADDAARAWLDDLTAAGLGDARVEVRRRAACYFEHRPHVAAAIALQRDLDALAAGAATLFAGIDDPLVPRFALWDALADAVVCQGNAESRQPGARPALTAAWRALLAGRGTGSLLNFVAREDVARIGDHAAALAHSGIPLDELLVAVSDAPSVALKTVKALADAGTIGLGDAVSSSLSDPLRGHALALVGRL